MLEFFLSIDLILCVLFDSGGFMFQILIISAGSLQS